MDATKAFMKYYADLDRRFHFFFMELLREPGPETIHDLRVNLKKQVAFFRLLEALDDSFIAEKAIDVFTEFYKKAGKVRDIQVERQVVEAEEAFLHLGRHLSLRLRREEKIRTADLQNYEREFSLEPVRALTRLVKNRLQYLPVDELSERLSDYFGCLIEQVKRTAELGERREKELHNLRKRLKELFYNLQLLDQLIPALRLEQTDEFALLEECQSMLGDWHDYDFAVNRLAGEARPELMARMREDCAALHRRIREHLPALLRALPVLDRKLQGALRTTRFEQPQIRPQQMAGGSYAAFKQMNVDERYL